MKSYLYVQLVANGRTIWQVKQDVPESNCRRMTSAELAAFGLYAQQGLANIIKDPEPAASTKETFVPHVEPRKKR